MWVRVPPSLLFFGKRRKRSNFITKINFMKKQQREVKKVKRKGIHAKSKTSKLKNSKNYKKLYRGQG